MGLVPSWAPDASMGNQMTNARAETLPQKPSFRRLVSQRHCLISADGSTSGQRHFVFGSAIGGNAIPMVLVSGLG